MDSEQAESIIRSGEWMDDETGERAVYVRRAYEALEVAEQEAEERIRRKAAEAYKVRCFHRDKDLCSISYDLDENGDYDAPQMCDKYCEYCGELEKFIQKLNEE